MTRRPIGFDAEAAGGDAFLAVKKDHIQQFARCRGECAALACKTCRHFGGFVFDGESGIYCDLVVLTPSGDIARAKWVHCGSKTTALQNHRERPLT